MRLAALFVATATLLAAQQDSQVAGRVLDPGGAGVANAAVSLFPMAAGGSIDATSNASGAFTMTGVPAGSYRMCVQAAAGDFLNPCQSGDEPATVDVSAGQRVNGVEIRLRRGKRIDIRIDDPQGTLAASENPTVNAQVLVGVWGPNGLFQPASVMSSDVSGRTHSLVVPLDTDLKLTVSGRKLVIDDEAGTRVGESDEGIPVRIEASRVDEPRSFRFVIRSLTP
jgi:hypothetical protein